MRALAVDFPSQLRRGFQAGQALELPIRSASRSASFVGMGGSAIAADLLENVLRAETDWSLQSGRTDRLPTRWDPDAVHFFVSYSGETAETLAAYASARDRVGVRVTLSSGGTLARLSGRDGLPHVPLPSGLPPRGALGWIMGGILGVLDAGLPKSYEGRLIAACDRLDAAQAQLASAEGPAARLARRLGSRVPTFLADQGFEAVARRWTTQVQENAKRLAFRESLPEAAHNALAAWDAMRPAEARRWGFIFLEPMPSGRPRSTGYLRRLLARRGARVERVRSSRPDRLEAVLHSVSFGDHFSLFLAEQAGVDPWEIRALDRAKRSARPR